eukprot:comp20776_c0_seq1/m.27277 comp20776_c0_seq1/g.27277  ORF comp20776_c0_seq1/g.27277 comp20776_c0_seq1/m.27277 type:complete len:474 (-) comp20776_c0_seq1:268-1689(-)
MTQPPPVAQPPSPGFQAVFQDVDQEWLKRELCADLQKNQNNQYVVTDIKQALYDFLNRTDVKQRIAETCARTKLPAYRAAKYVKNILYQFMAQNFVATNPVNIDQILKSEIERSPDLTDKMKAFLDDFDMRWLYGYGASIVRNTPGSYAAIDHVDAWCVEVMGHKDVQKRLIESAVVSGLDGVRAVKIVFETFREFVESQRTPPGHPRPLQKSPQTLEPAGQAQGTPIVRVPSTEPPTENGDNPQTLIGQAVSNNTAPATMREPTPTQQQQTQNNVPATAGTGAVGEGEEVSTGPTWPTEEMVHSFVRELCSSTRNALPTMHTNKVYQTRNWIHVPVKMILFEAPNGTSSFFVSSRNATDLVLFFCQKNSISFDRPFIFEAVTREFIRHFGPDEEACLIVKTIARTPKHTIDISYFGSVTADPKKAQDLLSFGSPDVSYYWSVAAVAKAVASVLASVQAGDYSQYQTEPKPTA